SPYTTLFRSTTASTSGSSSASARSRAGAMPRAWISSCRSEAGSTTVLTAMRGFSRRRLAMCFPHQPNPAIATVTLDMSLLFQADSGTTERVSTKLIHSGEATPMKDERSLLRCRHRNHLADDDLMVPAFVAAPRPAFQSRGSAGNQRHAAKSGLPVDAGELVRRRVCELPADPGLVHGEDVDCKCPVSAERAEAR